MPKEVVSDLRGVLLSTLSLSEREKHFFFFFFTLPCRTAYHVFFKKNENCHQSRGEFIAMYNKYMHVATTSSSSMCSSPSPGVES